MNVKSVKNLVDFPGLEDDNEVLIRQLCLEEAAAAWLELEDFPRTSRDARTHAAKSCSEKQRTLWGCWRIMR